MIVLAKKDNGLILLVICSSLVCFSHCFKSSPMACNVSLTYSCPAWLYYVPQTPKTIKETTSLFRSNLVNRTRDGYVIGVNCNCPVDQDEFVWHSHIDYTVQPSDTWERISSKFGSFVVEKPNKTLIAPLNIQLDILCGCSESGEVLSYRIVRGDTLFTISSRFNADLNKTAQLNKLENPALINAGEVIFIPEPAGINNLILVDNKDPKVKKVSKFQIPMIVGLVIAAVVVVLLLIIIYFWRCNRKRKGTQQSKVSMRAMSYLSCNLMSPPSHIQSGESVVASFNSEKATDFPYNEVRDATSNFSLSLKIGQGSYGSVYLGKLRGNDVAIKQMKNTKSREFFSELNILCKVHHTNLIELIGYAAGGDSLFLVYEFAENGALSDHLHNPAGRVYKPLPWKTRVQIALDAAKGLEYIHMHTKPYYVHRDVKTSNILLDANFRAKIADFGLVKLLEQSPDVRTAASRIVGTFGYLAPEYVRDGCVTTKSDVYGFGVVLMELLTGQPALSRDATPINPQYSEHRSLVDYILSVLESDDPLTKLTQRIDPNLTNYHKDSLLQNRKKYASIRKRERNATNRSPTILDDSTGNLTPINVISFFNAASIANLIATAAALAQTFQLSIAHASCKKTMYIFFVLDSMTLYLRKVTGTLMALLSKDCVDDDWNRRPDMCKVVIRLSHILVCSEQ